MRPDGPPSWRLMLGATGVVFGDIGTSPLYAFRESFIGHHRLPISSYAHQERAGHRLSADR
jgi:KUP system potassium uptake protein